MTRNHQQIISDFGGVTRVRDALRAHGFNDLKDPTVRSWDTRNSIPPEWWHHLASLNVATHEELAAATAKPLPEPSHDAVQHETAIDGANCGQPMGDLATGEFTEAVVTP